MQIYGPANLHGPHAVGGPHNTRNHQQGTRAASQSAADQLEISPAAEMAARLSEIPEVRQDRIDAIRAAIADGSYETADKLDGALDRLLDEIG